MRVNGKMVDIEGGITLLDFLESKNYDAQKIAVERNGAIVPRGTYDQVVLSYADKLEIVSFVGGG